MTWAIFFNYFINAYSMMTNTFPFISCFFLLHVDLVIVLIIRHQRNTNKYLQSGQLKRTMLGQSGPEDFSNIKRRPNLFIQTFFKGFRIFSIDRWNLFWIMTEINGSHQAFFVQKYAFFRSWKQINECITVMFWWQVFVGTNFQKKKFSYCKICRLTFKRK